jgi:hypothetical protein
VQYDDRQDALDVLDDALLWQLPPGRWVEIERAVEALVQALANGDDASFRQATADLELLGPVRAASAEKPPSGPSPEPAREPVRERINELVRSLVRPQGGVRPASGR